MKRSNSRAFTIVELLVVVSIIALLIGILLPAISKAREAAQLTQSLSNLRNLGSAHQQYQLDYSDHQFSLINDNLSSYGNNLASALAAFQNETGEEHPPIYAGWGRNLQGVWVHWILASAGSDAIQPMSFTTEDGSGGERFGSFRLLNVEAFHTYVNGRFYDPIFYAPKDRVVWSVVEPHFDYPDPVHYQGYGLIEWSSYCFSPAAMFHPDVMRRPSRGGWQDPWELSGGFRSPSVAQASFPSLKTQFSEHHWLQNRIAADCNPGFDGGTYDGCEPYYYNHGTSSTPAVIFYDGHTDQLGVAEAMRADARVLNQTGGTDGLWSKDTYWGTDGYFIQYGYDGANTSFHTFTTDGIKGRDTTGE